MAYVVPSGIIQLMKGVRLDNRYAHTIYFANTTAQNTYFTSKVTHTFSAQSYTRHNNNVVRIKVAADSVMDCTYMRFQNHSNGKWYYAFINYVNYINENVTEIMFEIDVMQTWFFQTGHDIKPCFVDREHVSDDTFGIYHAPETPKTEEYTYNWIKCTEWFDFYYVIIQTSQSPQEGHYYDNGMFIGCNSVHIPNINSESVAESCAQYLEDMLGGSWDKNEQSAYVIDMYAFPQHFSSKTAADNIDHLYLAKPTKFDYKDGTSYTPKNNRLFSNPYCSLLVTDYRGDNALYEWEMFNDPTNIQFTFRGNPNGGGSISCYPRDYAGLDNNFDSGLLVTDFPKIAYSYDAYEAWVAGGGLSRLQTSTKLVKMQGLAKTAQDIGEQFGVIKATAGATQSLVDAALSAGTKIPSAVGSTAGAIQSMANSYANVVNRNVQQQEAVNNLVYEFKDAQYNPDIVYGQVGGDIAMANRIFDFNFISMFPKKDEAIRIDDFFSTYGYSIKQVKQPNITGRKHWNFLKTKGAVIGGDMPATSRQAISDIIDGGIFFWKNGDEIGDFRVEITNGSINNPIV